VPHGNGPGGNWRDGRWPRDTASRYAPIAPDLAALQDADEELRRATEGGNDPVCQLGTLGGGNHFIEVCLDERGHVWLMLHSGSRGIGNKIGTHFIARARRRAELDGITLPHRDLAWLPEGTPEFASYVRAVGWCQEYAHRNRDVMLGQVTRAVSQALGRDVVAIDAAINCHHNYVEQETHFGEQLWITRKGAVAAFRGRLGIIPGSMGAKSFIVEGLGNPESFMSCSHGAGRRLSRTRAKETISLDEHAAATRHVECRKDQGVLDETPAVYKSIDAVMAAQADLVKPIHALRQVICVKG
jgi:tRNA-splicing ligase RtcB (3'-phosphate/5'-hydroxy nucleic acid ligase)